MSPKKTLIFLGAGASHDCANGTSPPAEQWRPPLASQLFADNDTVRSELAAHPGAQLIHSTETDLSGVYSEGGKELDLERRLQEIAIDPFLKRSFVEVPLYLRDYLAQCSKAFIGARAETYAELLIRLLRSEHEIAFVSLNYDTLLERAITEVTNGSRQFGQLEDFMSGSPFVFKPHGSVNWARLHPRASDETEPALFLDNLAATDVRDRNAGTELLTFSFGRPCGPTPVHFRYRGPGHRVELTNKTSDHPAWAYPALTAPLAAKGDEFIVAPREHRERLADFQQGCAKYLFIGTSGYDQHVLRLLGTAIKQPIDLWIVNKGDQVSKRVVGRRILNGLAGKEVGGRGEQLGLHETQAPGFTEWVHSTELDQFLSS